MRTHSEIPLTIIIGMLFVAGLTPICAAQDEPIREGGITLRTCPPSSTRTGTCDLQQQETVIHSESEITTKVQVPLPESHACQANISIEFTQWNTIARVEGTIENSDCAASGGNYEIAVSIRDESGELKTTEFPQTWQRDDDQPVKFSIDYPIGENVELVRVHARRLQCSCTQAEDIEQNVEDQAGKVR